ncbi:DUF5716 family protein [Lachnospiraceae bacterium 29-84]
MFDIADRQVMGMRPSGGEWYIGIEIGNRWTQVSCYYPGLEEPEAKSTVAGTEIYRIPTALCRHKKTGIWHFGEEANRLAEVGEGVYVDYLMARALKQEEILLDQEYRAVDLFQIFLRKVIRMALPKGGIQAVTTFTFTLKAVTDEIVDLLRYISKNLGIADDQLTIQDYRESFYAFAVCQEPELWQYDVALFSYNGDEIWQKRLSFFRNTKPKVATVEERCLGRLPEEVGGWDAAFAQLVRKALAGKIVSTVYLIGSGFEGGWMKESLQAVCQGRRAFQGKSLYTKGACYSGALESRLEESETVYFCEYKRKEHILIKVSYGDKEEFFPLVEAGSNRHQVEKEFRMILEGEAAIDLWVYPLGEQEPRHKRLELTGLKVSGSRRCRLFVSLYRGGGDRLLLKVQDIGWGEIQPGTGLEWEYEISS